MSYKSIRDAIVDFLLEEDGPTAVEYAVMAALIIGVCIASVNFLSAKTVESFENSADAINGSFGN
jgi:pilus assembly protein Flp/PilA